MSTALTSAVELLERSLAYTRHGLAEVTPDRLRAPTPCSQWDLDALLHHMDDALDAFTEAATGSVALTPSPESPPRPESIRAKACALLGWWCQHPPEVVRVGGASLPSSLLVETAALEITVHGWDVHRTVGSREEVPDSLARDLLPVAHAVADLDRHGRFGAPVPTSPHATPSEVLVGFLGRS